jgi:hypothetical protein
LRHIRSTVRLLTRVIEGAKNSLAGQLCYHLLRSKLILARQKVAKAIVSVGFEFPGGLVETISTNSDRSLLDADIILFRSDLEDFPSERTVLGEARTYQGDRWLSENASFALKRSISHWQSQLKIAFDANKTIIVFLAPFEHVYIDSGKREHSGTGRNRQTTVMLSEADNYQILPIRLKATPSVGSGIKQNSDLGFLLPLWNLLKPYLQYQVMLEGEFKPILLTRTGDKIVGGVVSGNGI